MQQVLHQLNVSGRRGLNVDGITGSLPSHAPRLYPNASSIVPPAMTALCASSDAL